MTSREKILFVVQNAPPFQSGRAKQALKIANILREKGILVHIFSLDHELTSECFEGIDYRKSIFSARSNYAFLMKLCMENRYQAVHFHGFNYLVGMTNLLQVFGIKCVLNMSCKSFDTPDVLLSSAWLGKYQRKALKKLDHWIVQNRSDMHERYNTVYLPNIVETPSSLVPWEKRSRNILNVGVICPRKGQLELIKEFQQKKILAFKGWKLVFCGSYENDYEEYDEDYVNECLRLAKGDPSIVFMGHLDEKSVSKVMSKSKCFTAMSNNEGLSNAYLECLSHGLRPIIKENEFDELFQEMNLSESAIFWEKGTKVDYRDYEKDWDINSVSKNISNRYSENVILPKLENLYFVKKKMCLVKPLTCR